MVLVALAISVEKLLPRGDLIAKAIGAISILVGIALLARTCFHA